MSLVAILRHGLRLLVPLAVAQTIYLYLYPVFLGCAFPIPVDATFNGTVAPDGSSDGFSAFLRAARQHLPAPLMSRAPPAPFRLLALGDPQLEGDTSIPNAIRPRLSHFKSLVDHVTFKTDHTSLRERVRQSLHEYIDFLFEDIPDEIESARKHVDLFGNDFYLAHIYRSVHRWTNPTHVTVLGDLLGSQWISKDEFERRGDRYWNRVFRGAERLPDDLMAYPDMDYELAAILGGAEEGDPEDEAAWAHRAINVVGNHDIGYAGDINRGRLHRFERVFGKANYELRFELALNESAQSSLFDEQQNPDSDLLPPELRVVVLNDMNLDKPARDTAMQDDTFEFLNTVIRTSTAVEFKGHFTVVLTHIPLHKPEGVCVDDPFFSFYEHNGGVKEQNMLSDDASRNGFLQGIFGLSGDPGAPAGGMGRPGVILNGHDHEGCDTYHFIRQQGEEGEPEDMLDQVKVGEADDKLQNGTNKEDGEGVEADGSKEGEEMEETGPTWDATPWNVAASSRSGNESFVGAQGIPGIREITVRSMMGDFGGNAGLLSAWFDEETWSWKFEYATCALGKQHFWWFVHVLDIVTAVASVVYAVLVAVEAVKGSQGAGKRKVPSSGQVQAMRDSKTNGTGEKDTAVTSLTSTSTSFKPGPSTGDSRIRR